MTTTGTPSATAPDARTPEALAELLLAMADDEFVIGFWDSEWTGIAPMLEEDVAMSSIAQDEIGHARALYELLAELTEDDTDRIAFGREPADYRHAALMNHPRTDWAFTIARRYLYDNADSVRLDCLAASTYQPLAQLAAKMRREETYHLMHMSTWVRRLAGGAAAPRLRAAVERLWPDAQAVFAPLAGEAILLDAGILPEPLETLRGRWVERIEPELGAIGVSVPDAARADADGRRRRTDDFAWLWGEFTMVRGSEEGAEW